MYRISMIYFHYRGKFLQAESSLRGMNSCENVYVAFWFNFFSVHLLPFSYYAMVFLVLQVVQVLKGLYFLWYPFSPCTTSVDASKSLEAYFIFLCCDGTRCLTSLKSLLFPMSFNAGLSTHDQAV